MSLDFSPMQVSEQYAFLPREAVTKFLAMCMDCRKKRSGKSSEDSSTPNSVSPEHYAVDVNRNELDFSVPITDAYMKQAGNHHVPDTDVSATFRDVILKGEGISLGGRSVLE